MMTDEEEYLAYVQSQHGIHAEVCEVCRRHAAIAFAINRIVLDWQNGEYEGHVDHAMKAVAKVLTP